MSRVVGRLQRYEHQLFTLIHRRLQYAHLVLFFQIITHLGGATLTILFSLALILVTSLNGSSMLGWQCLTALALSHLPVALLKKLYPRRRPYLVIPNVDAGKNPLKDHSFPSGHTTAIFSVTASLALAHPVAAAFGLPIALLVGLSRIVLGLHYPSDVIAGCMLGSTTALATFYMIL